MDDHTNRSLADDPNFVASLEDLDRGLVDSDGAPTPTPPSVHPMPPRPPHLSTAAPAPATPVEPAEAVRPTVPPPLRPSAPPPTTSARRPLIDLFPPVPAAAAPAGGAPIPTPVAAPPPTVAVPLAPPRASRPARPMIVEPLPPPRAEQPEKPSYENFYGFREKPFGLSSDPRFFYHSTAHDEVAQELLSAIRSREPLVIVTGECGAGKTMLCRVVTDQLDRRTLTSLVGEPFTTIEDLLKTVLIDFGVIAREDLTVGRLATASRQDLSTALREFLVSLAPLQAFAVILLDDAHRLPPDLLEEVRVLSELDAGSRLLQIVLIGEPPLLRALGRQHFRSMMKRVTVRADLGPLADDEVPGYVLHRLGVAGTNPRVEFDDGAFAYIYELSAGLPRDVNLLCDAALRLGHAQSASVVDRALIQRAADELGIEPPASAAAIAVRVAVAVVLFLSLMLVGAAVGAFVFHDRVQQLIVGWEAVPPPPRAPALGQPRPLAPLPPPAIATVGD